MLLSGTRRQAAWHPRALHATLSFLAAKATRNYDGLHNFNGPLKANHQFFKKGALYFLLEWREMTENTGCGSIWTNSCCPGPWQECVPLLWPGWNPWLREGHRKQLSIKRSCELTREVTLCEDCGEFWRTRQHIRGSAVIGQQGNGWAPRNNAPALFMLRVTHASLTPAPTLQYWGSLGRAFPWPSPRALRLENAPYLNPKFQSSERRDKRGEITSTRSLNFIHQTRPINPQRLQNSEETGSDQKTGSYFQLQHQRGMETPGQMS